MATKKLGRGLKFLLSEKESTPTPKDGIDKGDNDQVGEMEAPLTVPLNSIQSNPFQPRKTWKTDELTELADSIKENGILQPILVRSQGNSFQIIAGERRVKAARLAGLIKIPAILREANDEEMHVLALVENVQREDLNPIEKARSFEALRRKTGWSHEALSLRLGMKRSTVTNYLRLLDLEEQILGKLEDKSITMGHARAILSIPKENQLSFAEEIVEKNYSVRETEERTRSFKVPSKKIPVPIKRKNKPAWLMEWEEILKQTIGCQATLKYQKGRGRIVFELPTKDEMTRVLNLLIDLGKPILSENILLKNKMKASEKDA
jgi:ParB family chromosome partitioning protein